MQQPRNQSGKLDIKSKLVRNTWMKEGMYEEKSKSFWAPFKGKSIDAVIVQSQTSTADDGHTIVMDYNSSYSGAARRGKEKAYGYGGVKLKFSDKLTSERLRYPINNGDKFDGVEIGDLSINEHNSSRLDLMDNWVRQEDQFFFDIGVGYLRGEAPTHGLQVKGTSFAKNGSADPFTLTAADKISYDSSVKMEVILKTGKGYSVGGNRRPMKPWRGENNTGAANPTPTFLQILTTQQTADIKLDAKFQTILQNADIRGRGNMLLTNVIGKIGNTLYMEAPSFMGEEDEKGNDNLGKSIVEMSGLRRCAIASANGTVVFEGTEAYDAIATTTGTVIFDRGLLIGAGAFSEGIGMDPDYKFQSSEDFGIDSESMMEWWGQAQATILTPENGDHKVAKIGNMTLGLCYFDTFVEKVA